MTSKTFNAGDTITFTATSGGYTSGANTPWVSVAPPAYGDPFRFVTAEQARRSLGLDTPDRTDTKEKITVSTTDENARIGVAASHPTTHQRARDESLLFATDSQQTIDGWVGQVLVLGEPVWQSPPFPAPAPTDAPDPETAALDAARTHLVETLRTLFGAAPANSNPTGFSQTTGA